MITKEEIEKKFGDALVSCYENIYDILFTLNLKKLGHFSSKYLDESIFTLENSGLLTLTNLKKGGVMECHIKIKNINDLDYAITHLDEWEDDWN